MHNYRPLVYFWIAEYNNGTALPQFDPQTGKENKFSEINHKKLKHFGWHPFTKELAQRILKNEKMTVIPSRNPSYTVTLEKGDKLVAHRTNTIKLNTRKNEANYRETVYVLGVEGKKAIQITEKGNIIEAPS